MAAIIDALEVACMRLPALLVAALCSILGSTASHATTISFEAMDLADQVPGEDLWEYSYEVGNLHLRHRLRLHDPL